MGAWGELTPGGFNSAPGPTDSEDAPGPHWVSTSTSVIVKAATSVSYSDT